MGDPQQRRDDGSARYWKLRTALELLKAGVWLVFQWLRTGGPFGPLP